MDNCPLCGMPMIDGPSVDRHHLIPKCKKGKEAELCHITCHRKIHSVFDESQLKTQYNTWPQLQCHITIAEYINWVRKQFKRDPEFIDHHKQANSRKRRR
jgi:hypothetical protein